MGDSTLVDLWIEGKFRAITVSRQAIESYLGVAADAAASMGEADRREFVRTHLGVVVSAATAWLRANPEAETIVIDSLNSTGARRTDEGERRTGDRRKGERRKINIGPPGGIERRRR
jgi:ABC-type phosphonate transport system ATPase subunit